MLKRGLEDRFEKALEAVHRADYRAAIAILSELVAEEPDNGEAWLRLGTCYLETRELGPAAEALARAVVTDPEGAPGYFFLGTAYGAAGDLERASACFRRSLDIDPGHLHADRHLIQTEALLESRAHYRAGTRLLYSAQPSVGDLNQALRELVESVALYENSPAGDNLQECARRLLVSQRWYTIPVTLTPRLRNWRAACREGYACFERRDWAAARDSYLAALRERCDTAFVHHALGFCFVMTDRIPGAVCSWLRVLELDSGYDFSRFGRLTPE